MMFKDKTILITGGSGSWGNELTRQILPMNPKQVIIYSRGEIAQVTMQRKFNDSRIKFVIGDVRDKEAVNQLFQTNEIQYVFHLAALKHVPICENQPQEAIKTNVDGTRNLINATIQFSSVEKFIYVSTDKAVDPINLYGMTKGIGERLTIQANQLTKQTQFLCIRAGNVLGTNGSLVPYLMNKLERGGQLTLTDGRMTRYFLTQERAIELLFFATENGLGGEIYVMNMPSFYIVDVFRVLLKHYGKDEQDFKVIGCKEGEKLHEALISPLEVSRTRYVNENYHVIYPQLNVGRTNFHIWDYMDFAASVPVDSKFTSETNLKNIDYLKELLKEGGYLQ